jgi:hypothetical protein
VSLRGAAAVPRTGQNEPIFGTSAEACCGQRGIVTGAKNVGETLRLSPDFSCCIAVLFLKRQFRPHSTEITFFFLATALRFCSRCRPERQRGSENVRQLRRGGEELGQALARGGGGGGQEGGAVPVARQSGDITFFEGCGRGLERGIHVGLFGVSSDESSTLSSCFQYFS